MAPVRSIAELFSRLRSSFLLSPSPLRREENPAHRLGRYGEKAAARFLRRHEKFKILFRNFRAPQGGEVDIVCRDRDILVFVEVKTRTHADFARPSGAVTLAKQKLIIRGALAWLRMLDRPEVIFRFDIVEVVMAEQGKPEFNLIRNAFQIDDRYIF